MTKRKEAPRDDQATRDTHERELKEQKPQLAPPIPQEVNRESPPPDPHAAPEDDLQLPENNNLQMWARDHEGNDRGADERIGENVRGAIGDQANVEDQAQQANGDNHNEQDRKDDEGEQKRRVKPRGG